MSWEYDFLVLAASIFKFLVLGLLPMCAIVVLGIYIRRIAVALTERRRIVAKARARAKSMRFSGTVTMKDTK